eukprot:1138757-Pelagomonas_calceolata.AAC.3
MVNTQNVPACAKLQAAEDLVSVILTCCKYPVRVRELILLLPPGKHTTSLEARELLVGPCTMPFVKEPMNSCLKIEEAAMPFLHQWHRMLHANATPRQYAGHTTMHG